MGKLEFFFFFLDASIWSYLHIKVRHFFSFIRFYVIMICNLLLMTMGKNTFGICKTA